MKRWIVGSAAALVAMTTWTFVWLEMGRVVIEETATAVAAEAITTLMHKQQVAQESAAKAAADAAASTKKGEMGRDLAAECLEVHPSSLSGRAIMFGIYAARDIDDIDAKAELAGDDSLQAFEERLEMKLEVQRRLCRALRGE